MWRVPGRADGAADPSLAEALGTLHARASMFDPARAVLMARAPGRLDLMGGIADYSGGLVLEFPIRQATCVFAQSCEARRLTILSLVSDGAASSSARAPKMVSISLDALTPAAGPLEYARARAWLGGDPEQAWAAYVAGALVVLQRERGRLLSRGANLLIHSDLPAGIGLASSAALEVAALETLAALTDTPLGERELALLAQMVENLIVGAPCGVMDQLTAVAGRAGCLIEILCQPAEARGHIPIPSALEVWGLDSGIRHAISGADYGSVRAATFMGYRMLAEEAGLAVTVDADSGRLRVDDPLFGGYPANVSPALWRARYRDVVPVALDGATFLERYGGTTDAATVVDPSRTYHVRACTEHPILEHERARRFRELLSTGATQEAGRMELGQLMYDSHASYGACGLGSDGTDRLVDLVRAAGPAAGLYGAKITGGGSGGTVAVLARRDCGPAVVEIASRYERETGRRCEAITGSSPGSRAFGVRHLEPSLETR